MLAYRAPLSPGQSPGGEPHPVLASRAPLSAVQSPASGQRPEATGRRYCKP